MVNIAFIFCAVYLTLFIYHFFVFVGRRKDLSNLAYSLYSLSLGIMLIADLILPAYFKIPKELINIYIMFASFGISFSSSLFLYSIFCLEKYKKIIYINFLIYFFLGTIFSIIYFFTKIWFWRLVFGVDAIYYILFFIIITIIEIIRLKQYKQKKQLIIMIGFAIVMLNYILLALRPFIIDYFGFPPVIIMNIAYVVMLFIFTYALTDSFNQEHRDLHIKTKQLEDLANTLEQRVLERTQQLEQATKQKTEAFINISHEIKTPVTIISNYLDKHIHEHGATKELEIAQQNTDKLKRDMLNVLDFEKLDKGLAFYDHSKITDISEVVRMNILMFSEIAERKGIKLKESIEENIYIKSDPHAVDRVINNLIDNAVKYTKSNGKINVSLRADRVNIELAIRDTGIGISEGNKEHIFKPYFQILEKKRNLQGIGMGLNIVKNIVDGIKGEIIVESILNKGSNFRILLNRYYLKEGDRVESIRYRKAKSVDAMDIYLKEEKYSEDRRNIFIVEDNIQMLSYLQENLMDSYNVYYAKNGKEALEKLKNISKPDTIISDIMMDDMDGYKFYEELLKLNEYRSVPFIFLTAKTNEYEKIKGLKKGALDFIPKPFNINELKAKVESLIKFRNALKEEKLDQLSDQIYRLLSGSKKFKIVKNENCIDEKIKQDKLLKDYEISRRQVEIFSLIENGYERKEIADKLNISLSTVKTHIERLYKKFGVNNKISLIKTIKSL